MDPGLIASTRSMTGFPVAIDGSLKDEIRLLLPLSSNYDENERKLNQNFNPRIFKKLLEFE